jgi:hypothetical protein
VKRTNLSFFIEVYAMLANDMRALELDLTGSNISVVMQPIPEKEFSQKFGFIGVSYDQPESLPNAVKRHLECGINYAVLGKPTLLDSQLEHAHVQKSLSFYYTPMKDNRNGVLLRIKGASYSVPYTNLRKIGFRDLPSIVEKLGQDFAPIPNRVTEVYALANFRSALSQPSEMLQPESEPALKQPQDKWLMLHGIKVKKQEDFQGEVAPPQIRWIQLDNYDLSGLERDFGIAEFERKISNSHVRKVLSSVLGNEFYDPVIKVIDLGEVGKCRFGVLDAQHRLVALKIARDTYGVKRYNLMLAVFEPEEARKIYENVNLGKPLTAKDYSKAWDNGSIPFFNELRDSLSHYPAKNKMTFIDLLYALFYSKHEAYYTRLHDAEMELSEVKPEEIERTKIFLRTSEDVWTSRRIGNPMYRPVVFRNMLRVYLESNMSPKKLAAAMDTVQRDKEIIDMSRGRHKRDFRQVYQMIRESSKKSAK